MMSLKIASERLSYSDAIYLVCIPLFTRQENYFQSCLSVFVFMLSRIKLSEAIFGDASYPSACFRTHSIAFSSRLMSNTLFSQRTPLALHPPHARMVRNFRASSAFWRLDCHCAMLPHRDKAQTTPSPTTKEKTFLDLMSQLCLWICSCGCCFC